VEVTADRDGLVVDVEPMGLALAANRLGAGRAKKGDPIDHAVGFEIVVSPGDGVSQGDTLARVHARTAAQLDDARRAVQAAVIIGAAPVAQRPIVLGRYSTAD